MLSEAPSLRGVASVAESQFESRELSVELSVLYPALWAIFAACANCTELHAGNRNCGGSERVSSINVHQRMSLAVAALIDVWLSRPSYDRAWCRASFLATLRGYAFEQRWGNITIYHYLEQRRL